MRILYISEPPFFDMDLSLVKHLSKYCEVTYLLDIPPYYRKSSAVQIENGYPFPGIFNSTIYTEFKQFQEFINPDRFYILNRTSPKKYALSNLILQKKIYDFVEKINPDIVHFSNFFKLNNLYFVLKTKRKLLLTVHDPLPHLGEATKQDRFLRNLNFQFIKNILLLNKQQVSLFKDITKQYSFRQIFVSSLGIYEYLQIYAKEKNQAVISDKKFTVLFFGRISPYKGIELLLKSFRAIEKQNQEVKLIIAGKGHLGFDPEVYQSDQISILNRYISNEELVGLIQSADIVVCPYLEATQSGVIMSAFALNKPVLATRVGNFEDVVEHEKTGFLIEPNDEEKLKEMLLFAVNNRHIIADMQENIKFENESGANSWKIICEHLIENYMMIIEK